MSVALAPALPLAGQQAGAGEDDVPPSRDVRLSELGVEDADSILGGSLTIVHTSEGPRMGVPTFVDERPPPPDLVVASAPPPTRGGCFALGIEQPGINALGGRSGTFATGGSTAAIDYDPDADQRRALRLRCAREGGPCGMWVHLFASADLEERTYLDASGLAALTLWARLTPAGAGVTLKSADAAWERREDALPLGDLAAFAPSGTLGSDWTALTVPLDSLSPRLHRDSLANFVFEATSPGATELELAGAELCRRAAAPAPLPPPLPATEGERGHRALWVWDTRELLADPAERARFLAFVEGRFDRVFLHLPPAEDRLTERGFVPFDGDRMGALVAELGARGALVYALDGDPSYVFPENHAGILATVRAVAAHNARVPPERRFHGVRYDVEAYLVPGWVDRREELLGHYLDLIAGIAVVAREGGLAFGVDVPFWFDEPDPVTGGPLSITWGGERRPALEHIVRRVDDIAVMGYRTTAYGADGSLILAIGELAAARDAGTGVFVGIETEDLPDEDLSDFQGPPARGLPPDDDRSWVVVESLDGGRDSVRVWLVDPGGRQALLEDLERRGVAEAALLHFPADEPVRVPGSRLSFRTLGLQRLEAEAARLLRDLGEDPAFVGLAFHHYGTMRELVPGGG